MLYWCCYCNIVSCMMLSRWSRWYSRWCSRFDKWLYETIWRMRMKKIVNQMRYWLSCHVNTAIYSTYCINLIDESWLDCIQHNFYSHSNAKNRDCMINDRRVIDTITLYQRYGEKHSHNTRYLFCYGVTLCFDPHYVNEETSPLLKHSNNGNKMPWTMIIRNDGDQWR